MERRLWLFYWLCFVAFYWCEWIVCLPFALLSPVLDLYYEAQVVGAIYLVHPRFMGIQKLLEALTKKIGEGFQLLTQKIMSKVQMPPQTAQQGSRVAAERPADAPGFYTVIKESGIMPTMLTAKSYLIGKLSVGQVINVVEIVHCEEERRVRARIEEPFTGWISLLNMDNGTRWAVPGNQAHIMAMPGMPAMPQGTDVFANAAAAGCNPGVLFQGAGAQGPLPTEAVAEDAWEAMALLESQLSRADDVSEDAASRQAATMLKQMLTMLVQQPNPAMLTMAQSMMPDLGKIWSNDDTRSYLHDLLTAPNDNVGTSSVAGDSGSASAGGSGSASTSSSAGGSASASAGSGSQ